MRRCVLFLSPTPRTAAGARVLSLSLSSSLVPAATLRRGASCAAAVIGLTPSSTLSSSPASSSLRGFFTNKKKHYGPPIDERDAQERGATEPFFAKKVESEADLMDARKVEQRLASRKQLEEELPTAEELERALKEGKMDQYVQPADDDDSYFGKQK